MSKSPEPAALSRLTEAIDALIATHPPGPILIGFSGGLDSSMLLACAARSALVRARGLRAIHVHHGLHADADHWAARALVTATALGVPLSVLRVKVDPRGQGLEAAARDARYAAFAGLMGEPGWLLLAHHREDQAETVLLRLLRGAALDGIAGMRPVRAFAGGWLGRPWLHRPRQELRETAQALGLNWIEDPANQDRRHDRVYLRKEIWPLLQARFPAVGERLARFAEHAQSAQQELEDLASRQLESIRSPDRRTLAIGALLGLSDALFGVCLRRFALDLGAPAPGFHELARLRREVLGAAHDANPCLRWHGCEFRRYRDRLYLLAQAHTEPAPQIEIEWPVGSSRCALPTTLGWLDAIDDEGRPSPLPTPLQVRFRHAGERIRPAACAHTRELRLLFQERGVPTWERQRVPLLFDGKTLLMAVGLVVSAEFAARYPGLMVVWQSAG